MLIRKSPALLLQAWFFGAMPYRSLFQLRPHQKPARKRSAVQDSHKLKPSYVSKVGRFNRE